MMLSILWKYSCILQQNGPEDFDKLHDEFIAYHLIQVSDIPDSIRKEAEIRVHDNEEAERSTISRYWRSKRLRGIRSLLNSMSVENVLTHSENCSLLQNKANY